MTQCTTHILGKCNAYCNYSAYGESRDDVAIELEDGLPASLGDMDEAYKDDIIYRDATWADLPGRTPALPPGEKLLKCLSLRIDAKKILMASPPRIWIPHVRRVPPMFQGRLYFALAFGPWS